MASSWQGSHYVAVLGAAGLAFAAGYAMGGRQPPRPVAIDIGNNVIAPISPYEINQAEAPPPARRGRIDENELIAANAEPEDGQQQRQRPPATGQPDRDAGTRAGQQEQRRGSRQAPDREQPPEEDFQQEEQDPYGPEGE